MLRELCSKTGLLIHRLDQFREGNGRKVILISPQLCNFIYFYKDIFCFEERHKMKVPPPSYYESTNPPPSSGLYPPSPQFQTMNAIPDYPTTNPTMHSPNQNGQPQIYGPHPQQVYCPICKQHIITEVEFVSNILTWILFAISCLLCFCCCFVPLCMKSCKDVEHRCPQCKTFLGIYERCSGRKYRQMPSQV